MTLAVLRKGFAFVLTWLLLGATTLAGAQGPEVEWEKTFGGSGDDSAACVQQTADGGYIVAGYTGDMTSSGAGAGDVCLIKTDASGDVLWEKTFGGSKFDSAWYVQHTSDGGYIVAGTTFSFGAGGGDIYLIKTDASGDAIWEKTFGGSGGEWAGCIQQTRDGGYIVAGGASYFVLADRDSDVYLIKTDTSGNEVWKRTFGGSGADSGYCVQQTSDGGYIIAGVTGLDYQGRDVYLIKTSASGNVVWERTFGGSKDDSASYVQQTSDGGYIVAGYTNSVGAGGEDVYLIKTNASGYKVWEKTFGGSADDYANCVQQTTDGGYIIAGWTRSFGAGDNDVYLVRTDALGNELWEKTFGGSKADLARYVQQTSDGGYIVAGETSSSGAGGRDVYLIKLKPERVPQPAVLPGDMNGDGKIGISDATIALLIAVGLLKTPTQEQTQAGDINGNGKIDVADVVMILRIAVGAR